MARPTLLFAFIRGFKNSLIKCRDFPPLMRENRASGAFHSQKPVKTIVASIMLVKYLSMQTANEPDKVVESAGPKLSVPSDVIRAAGSQRRTVAALVEPSHDALGLPGSRDRFSRRGYGWKTYQLLREAQGKSVALRREFLVK